MRFGGMILNTRSSRLIRGAQTRTIDLTMTLQMMNYLWDRDFDRARRFLGEIYPIRRSYSNWIPSRWENMKFGPGGDGEYLDEEDEYLKIWEIDDQIVALSRTQPSGECILLIHPEYTSHSKQIIQWMQERVREVAESDEVKMNITADDADTELVSALTDLGFKMDESDGDNQVRPVDAPIPEYSLPEGYTVRHAVDEDYEKYLEVQSSVFGHMRHMTKKRYDLYRRASFYNEELDIVAVAPNGEFAAFCTGRIDPVSKIAELEPVGTHPDHRKKGLAKVVILECLKRLEKSGYVPTGVFRYDKYTIAMHRFPNQKVTDPRAFRRHMPYILDALKSAQIRHGDLTEKAILVWRNNPFMIDFAESRLWSDPRPDKRPEGDAYWLEATFNKLCMQT